MNTIENHNLRHLEVGFKISYFILAFGTFNSYIYGSAIQPMLVKIVLMLGGVLSVLRLIFYKKYIKMPAMLLMILFCISFLISTFINRKYGIVDNGKWIIWTGMQFFLLYICDIKRDIDFYKKEFQLFSHVIFIFSFFSAISSLWFLIIRYSSMVQTIDGELLISGFIWGRLWGTYTDPNYGAVFSVIAMLLAVYFIAKKKGLWKVIYILVFLVNFLYLIFSDSRTGELSFVCGMGFFLCGIIWKKKNIISGRKKITLCILSFLCLTFISIASFRIIKSEYNQQLAPVFVKIFPKEELKTADKNKKIVVPKAIIGRKDDLEKDISNGRISLWESGVEVWKTAPIFGTGYSTFLAYAKDHVPKTYAINNDQGEYASLHNSFINTLVFQGILGLFILLAIGMYTIFYICKYLRALQGEDVSYILVMLSCVGVVVISMFFLLEGLYTNSMGSFVLWTFLGYLVHYAYKVKEVKKI